MKCACLAILICIVSIRGFSQNVTISEKDIPLGKMMNLIRKQTGYYFSFSSGITGEATKVSLNVNNKPLTAALDILFSKLPFTYVLKGKFILIIERKTINTNVPSEIAVSGSVENENGDPIEGANISILNTKKVFTTNSAGQFTIYGLSTNTTLQISSIGYETKQIVLLNQDEIKIKLKIAASGLDEALVIGYGKTTRRLNTGNVTKVKGSEIQDQPVSNFVEALTGRIPSMLISQVNGIPGTAYKTQIQGRSSIGTSLTTDPYVNVLYIVDGTPFALNNNNLPTIASGSSLADGRNSFDLINTKDIESIDVLKDADATAIYGSRGANGVVLITTKKGIRGKPAYHIAFNTDLGRITKYPDMMNTDQYVKMRRTAILNDGNSLNLTNAPDLYKWDTSRYTDLEKILIGGTAKASNVSLSIDGGNKLFSYLFSGSIRKQTTVFPGDFRENTFYSHGNVQYKSVNNRLGATISLIATMDDNLSPSRDMTTYVNLPPNVPAFYDSTGGLVWQYNGYSYNNPMATLLQPYQAITSNILLNLNSSYNITNELTFKINAGFNNISSKESVIQPKKSFSNPNAIATSYFANTGLKSSILEPQLEFNSHIGKGRFSVLIGSTYQMLDTRITNKKAYFPTDSTLNDINKATSVTSTPNNSVYKYLGTFGRVSYNWLDKYILNFTGRRDGSSRFGKGRQYGNFGAFGAAWIFTKEPFVYQNLPYLNFGKLRISYGITGSDQIGDYQYSDQWTQSSNTYQGITGIYPLGPANPYYSWQTNKKLAIGFEVGTFENKMTITAEYYRNRTGNQIISVSLPGITGFDWLSAANYPAVIQNSGCELTLQLNSIKKKDYSLNSRIVLSIPKNSLFSFPNLSISQYANRDIHVGHSLYSNSGLTYEGIDKNTGLFKFKDFDNDGTISFPNDYSIVVNREPKCFGSLLNSFKYKNFELECLIEIKDQASYNFLYNIYRNKPPGGKFNQPALLNSYWQNPGEQTYIQKPTANTTSEAYSVVQNFLTSNAVFSKSNYVKIKYAAVSYRFSERAVHKLHLKQCRFYLSANNIATFTGFKATDNETINTSTLPPLRNISLGMDIAF